MMKTLNDYIVMNYRMEVAEDTDEGGFIVSFPELPGCITCRIMKNMTGAPSVSLSEACDFFCYRNNQYIPEADADLEPDR